MTHENFEITFEQIAILTLKLHMKSIKTVAVL